MRLKHSALILTAGFLMIPTLTWSQGPGRGDRGNGGGGPGAGGGNWGGAAPGFAAPAGGGMPGMGGGGMRSGRMMGDPDQFFDQYSKDGKVLRREDLPAQMQTVLQFMGPQLGLTGNEWTRDQLRQTTERLKAQFGGGGGMAFTIPGGGAPGGFAVPGGANDADRRLEEVFKRMDKNEDGVLDYNEMSETLQGERDKYDTNHDGVIDLPEFKAYVAARRGDGAPDRGADGGPRKADGDTAGEDERKRPTLIRAGNLPKDFPYAQLDTDQDGQIGLYEWKKAGKPTAEFLAMDLNNDGFLTVDEYFHWRKQGQELAMKASGQSGSQTARAGRNGGMTGGAAAGGEMMAMGMPAGGQWPGGGGGGQWGGGGNGFSGMPMGIPGGGFGQGSGRGPGGPVGGFNPGDFGAGNQGGGGRVPGGFGQGGGGGGNFGGRGAGGPGGGFNPADLGAGNQGGGGFAQGGGTFPTPGAPAMDLPAGYGQSGVRQSNPGNTDRGQGGPGAGGRRGGSGAGAGADNGGTGNGAGQPGGGRVPGGRRGGGGG